MPVRQSFEPETTHRQSQAEVSEEAVDRADTLREAQAADAADYVRRFESYTREVHRLKLGDRIASNLFPLCAWALALYGMVTGVFWIVGHSGGRHSSFGRVAIFIILFGFVGITAAASWLARREAHIRKQDQPERIREIAARHGVEPDRPRMDR